MLNIIAKQIKKYREMRNLSMTELAKKTGLTVSAISQFESGKREPSLKSFGKLVKTLNVTSEHLLKTDIEWSKIYADRQKVAEFDKKENKMKLLFILIGDPRIELHITARSEKEAIAKANEIAPREKYYVSKVFQQDEDNKIGILEDLVDAIRNIEFRHNE